VGGYALEVNWLGKEAREEGANNSSLGNGHRICRVKRLLHFIEIKQIFAGKEKEEEED